MRPIRAVSDIHEHLVIHHAAFGFAHVDTVVGRTALVSWAQPHENLPRRISIDVLSDVYSFAVSGGFFDQALKTPDQLRDHLHHNPMGVLELLLWDLEGPQTRQDLMDWVLGVGLLNAKGFQRWWDLVVPIIAQDARIRFDGATMALAEAPDPDDEFETSLPTLVGLELEPAEFEAGVDVPPPASPPPASTWPPSPTRFSCSLPLGGAQVLTVGAQVADILARIHAADLQARPDADRVWLHPDGTVTFEEDDAPEPLHDQGLGSARGELYRAALLVIDALLARPWPRSLSGHLVDSHLRQLVDHLPASAMAPLEQALQPNEERRPDAAQWAESWHAALSAEATRKPDPDGESRVRFGYDTHIGRGKLTYSQTNQDTLLFNQRGPLGMFLVCDGITTCDVGSGDAASALTTQVLAGLWEREIGRLADLTDLAARSYLHQALRVANRAVCDTALRISGGKLRGRAPMGTTIVAGVSMGDRIHLAWLGDSRAYLVGPYGASMLTADHNEAGERLLAWNGFTVDRCVPTGHSLVRYVGHYDADWRPASMPPGTLSFTMLPGERLVLCSDGVTDYIAPDSPSTAEIIASTCSQPDLDEACWDLVRRANRRGGGDNITVLVLTLT